MGVILGRGIVDLCSETGGHFLADGQTALIQNDLRRLIHDDDLAGGHVAIGGGQRDRRSARLHTLHLSRAVHRRNLLVADGQLVGGQTFGAAVVHRHRYRQFDDLARDDVELLAVDRHVVRLRNDGDDRAGFDTSLFSLMAGDAIVGFYEHAGSADVKRLDRAGAGIDGDNLRLVGPVFVSKGNIGGSIHRALCGSRHIHADGGHAKRQSNVFRRFFHGDGRVLDQSVMGRHLDLCSAHADSLDIAGIVDGHNILVRGSERHACRAVAGESIADLRRVTHRKRRRGGRDGQLGRRTLHRYLEGSGEIIISRYRDGCSTGFNALHLSLGIDLDNLRIAAREFDGADGRLVIRIQRITDRIGNLLHADGLGCTGKHNAGRRLADGQIALGRQSGIAERNGNDCRTVGDSLHETGRGIDGSDRGIRGTENSAFRRQRFVADGIAQRKRLTDCQLMILGIQLDSGINNAESHACADAIVRFRNDITIAGSNCGHNAVIVNLGDGGIAAAISNLGDNIFAQINVRLSVIANGKRVLSNRQIERGRRAVHLDGDGLRDLAHGCRNLCLSGTHSHHEAARRINGDNEGIDSGIRRRTVGIFGQNDIQLGGITQIHDALINIQFKIERLSINFNRQFCGQLTESQPDRRLAGSNSSDNAILIDSGNRLSGRRVFHAGLERLRKLDHDFIVLAHIEFRCERGFQFFDGIDIDRNLRGCSRGFILHKGCSDDAFSLCYGGQIAAFIDGNNIFCTEGINNLTLRAFSHRAGNRLAFANNHVLIGKGDGKFDLFFFVFFTLGFFDNRDDDTGGHIFEFSTLRLHSYNAGRNSRDGTRGSVEINNAGNITCVENIARNVVAESGRKVEGIANDQFNRFRRKGQHNLFSFSINDGSIAGIIRVRLNVQRGLHHDDVAGILVFRNLVGFFIRFDGIRSFRRLNRLRLFSDFRLLVCFFRGFIFNRNLFRFRTFCLSGFPRLFGFFDRFRKHHRRLRQRIVHILLIAGRFGDAALEGCDLLLIQRNKRRSIDPALFGCALIGKCDLHPVVFTLCNALDSQHNAFRGKSRNRRLIGIIRVERHILTDPCIAECENIRLRRLRLSHTLLFRRLFRLTERQFDLSFICERRFADLSDQFTFRKCRHKIDGHRCAQHADAQQN